MGENGTPTTIGGFILVAGVMILTYLLKTKAEKPREEAKLGNLESQSKSLVDQTAILREILDSQKKYSKYGKKQAKKINKKLGSIHEDVILVKQYTYKEKK